MTVEYQYRIEWLAWDSYRGNDGEWMPRWRAPTSRLVAEQQAASLRAIEREGGGVRGVVLLTRAVAPWVEVGVPE